MNGQNMMFIIPDTWHLTVIVINHNHMRIWLKQQLGICENSAPENVENKKITMRHELNRMTWRKAILKRIHIELREEKKNVEHRIACALIYAFIQYTVRIWLSFIVYRVVFFLSLIIAVVVYTRCSSRQSQPLRWWHPS